jgi:hypothetical protein
MTGAIALAVVLVVAVIGISMAMQSQRTLQAPSGPRSRMPRPQRPSAEPRRSQGRTRERRGQAPEPPAAPPPAAAAKEPEFRGPELLRSGVAAEAKVLSVVDERTTGPVTRSRLALEITPAEGSVFEVTVRVAFPTPEARSRVKVGGPIPVRYDKDDRTKVVVDIPQA